MKTTDDELRDPVCGMRVNETSAINIEQDGQTYYFCSEGCRETFSAKSVPVKEKSKSGGCC